MRKAWLLGGGLAAALVMTAGALTPGWSQLSPSANWPKFQHDLLNTGRSHLAGPASIANANLKWSQKMNSWVKTQIIVSAPPPVGPATSAPDEFVYFAHSKEVACKYNAQTGAKVWCSGLGGFANQSSPAIGNATGGPSTFKIYRGERNNKFWSIENDTGNPTPPPRGSAPADNVWDLPGWPFKIQLDGDVFSSPAIHPTDHTIYTACGCLTFGGLHAFNPDGSQKWPAFKIGKSGIRNSSPALVIEGTTPVIYIGSTDGFLSRVIDIGTTASTDAAHGGWRRKPATGAQMVNASPSVFENGTTRYVYTGSTKGLTSYTADTSGTLRWHVLSGVGDFDVAPAIGPELGGNTRYIYASAFKTGKRTLYRVLDNGTANPPTQVLAGPVPSAQTLQYVSSPSPVVDKDGNVYAPMGNQVIRFNASGAETSRFTADFWVIAVSLGNGVLYVSDRDSKVYAIGN